MSLKSDLMKQARFGGRLLAWDYPRNYRPVLDGVSQYWSLSSPIVIPADSDFSISFTIKGTEDLFEGIFESSVNGYLWLRLLPTNQNSNFQGYNGNQYFGGLDFHKDIVVRDGKEHRITIYTENDILYIQMDDLPSDRMRDYQVRPELSFDSLARFANTYFKGVFYDLEVSVNGTVIHRLPLTNKLDGAEQKDTVGDLVATLVNYTDAVWEEEEVHYPTYIAQLDGSTQHWELTEPLTLYRDDEITFDIIAEDTYNDGLAMILCYTGIYRTLLRIDDGEFVSGLGEVTENGVPVTHIATDGRKHTYTFKITTSTSELAYLGAQDSGSGFIRRLDNPISNLKVSRAGDTILNIPMNIKGQGELQLATVGDINARIVNYSDSVWIPTEPELPKYRAELDGVTQSWQLSNSIFQGDFDVSVVTRMPWKGFTDARAIMGADRSRTDGLETFVLYMQAGKIRAQIPTGTGVEYGINYVIPDNKLNKETTIRLTRNGGVYSLYLDDTLLGTRDYTSKGLVGIEVHRLGNWAGIYYPGYFKDYIERDPETGDIKTKIPIDNYYQGRTQYSVTNNKYLRMANYTRDIWKEVSDTDKLFVAKLDGATQYWELSDPINIPSNTDCSIKFNLIGNQDRYEGLISSASDDAWIRLVPKSSTNNLQGNLNGSFIGGVSFDEVSIRDGSSKEFIFERLGGKFYAYIDGSRYSVSGTINGSFSISEIGEALGDSFLGSIYGLEVKIAGEVTHRIPLNRLDQGANQLPTVGNVSATLVNYTASVWEEYIPEKEFVAELDGATQYWELSEPIALSTGYKVELKVTRPSGPSERKQWFASGDTLRINVQRTNIIEEVGGDLLIDGTPITNYITEYPIDGETHLLEYNITTESISLSNLGAAPSGMEKLGGWVSELKVLDSQGTLIYAIPLTNRENGPLQLGTVGNVNATLVNYTEAVWKEI